MDTQNLNHIGEMTTLSEVLNALANDGYTFDFNLKNDQLNGIKNPVQEHPEQFLIDKYYRFEGASDPEDEAIVYAISAINGEIKGVLVNGYGALSENCNDEIIKKLSVRND